MARRRRWKGAQLDGLLSTPIAANFGAGPEEAAEGFAAGQGIALYASLRPLWAWPGGGSGGRCSWTGSCFVCLPPSTLGLARRGRRKGAQLEWEFAVYASRCRLWAWPGGSGGGATALVGSLLF